MIKTHSFTHHSASNFIGSLIEGTGPHMLSQTLGSSTVVKFTVSYDSPYLSSFFSPRPVFLVDFEEIIIILGYLCYYTRFCCFPFYPFCVWSKYSSFSFFRSKKLFSYHTHVERGKKKRVYPLLYSNSSVLGLLCIDGIRDLYLNLDSSDSIVSVDSVYI